MRFLTDKLEGGVTFISVGIGQKQSKIPWIGNRANETFYDL